jgi:hypothetical protein
MNFLAPTARRGAALRFAPGARLARHARRRAARGRGRLHARAAVVGAGAASHGRYIHVQTLSFCFVRRTTNEIHRGGGDESDRAAPRLGAARAAPRGAAG